MTFEDMKYLGSTRVVASIYPELLSMQLDFGPTPKGGKTIYRIEGCPKGEIRTLMVEDGWQSVIDYHNCQSVGKHEMIGMPEPAEKIARELVREWTSGAGAGPGVQPGVILCAGKEPSKAEKDHLFAVQSACFEFLAHEADGFAEKHQWRQINEKHRIALKWLGWERAWGNPVGESAQSKSCPYCYSRIDSRASYCKECHKDIPVPVGVPVAAAKHTPEAEKPFRTTAVPGIPLPPPLHPTA